MGAYAAIKWQTAGDAIVAGEITGDRYCKRTGIEFGYSISVWVPFKCEHWGADAVAGCSSTGVQTA